MARFETIDMAASGTTTTGSPEFLYELGLLHATGRDGREDLVTAHKWFNIAAFRGNHMAKARREEIAIEMTRAQIASAQRAAREWLQAN